MTITHMIVSFVFASVYVYSCANTATYRESHADFEAGRYVHVPTRAYRWIQTQSPVSRVSNSRCRNVDMLRDNRWRNSLVIRSRNIKKEIEKISAVLILITFDLCNDLIQYIIYIF